MFEAIPLAAHNDQHRHAVHELLLSARSERERFAFKIKGDCMTPVFCDQDVVMVHLSKRYYPGDVVVYSNPVQGQVAHRLLGGVRIRGVRKYLIKPDNVLQTDPLVTSDQLLGKVVTVNQHPLRVSISQRFLSGGAYVFWLIRISIRKRLGLRHFRRGRKNEVITNL